MVTFSYLDHFGPLFIAPIPFILYIFVTEIK